MFIGHYGVAFAAKRVAPGTSLGTLFLAAQFLDFLWPLLVLLGVEHVRIAPGNTAFTPLDFYDYPISHGLLTSIGWSVVIGLIYLGVRRYPRGALTVGLLVFSHWILDFITHRPDLPLGPGSSTMFGLGLWNSPGGTIVAELGIFMIGSLLYLRGTAAKDRSGAVGAWALIIVLVAVWVANMLGPPPPSVRTIAVAANAAWLFVIWAYVLDIHRTVKSAAPLLSATDIGEKAPEQP